MKDVKVESAGDRDGRGCGAAMGDGILLKHAKSFPGVRRGCGRVRRLEVEPHGVEWVP